MTNLTKALEALQNWLKDQEIPFMVIGGVANLIWGEPRLTQDIDITIKIPEERTETVVADLERAFKVLPKNPLDFVRTTHVLPLEIENVRVDLIFAGLEYEKAAIARATDVSLGEIEVHVCTPEDLIVHKAISQRERDWEDMEGILLKQTRNLDKAYITKWLKEFSGVLDRPEILETFQKKWSQLAAS